MTSWLKTLMRLFVISFSSSVKKVNIKIKNLNGLVKANTFSSGSMSSENCLGTRMHDLSMSSRLSLMYLLIEIKSVDTIRMLFRMVSQSVWFSYKASSFILLRRVSSEFLHSWISRIRVSMFPSSWFIYICNRIIHTKIRTRPDKVDISYLHVTFTATIYMLHFYEIFT